MQNLIFVHKFRSILLHTLIAVALIGAFFLTPINANNVAAASATVPINMIYYGWHNTTVDTSYR